MTCRKKENITIDCYNQELQDRSVYCKERSARTTSSLCNHRRERLQDRRARAWDFKATRSRRCRYKRASKLIATTTNVKITKDGAQADQLPPCLMSDDLLP